RTVRRRHPHADAAEGGASETAADCREDLSGTTNDKEGYVMATEATTNVQKAATPDVATSPEQTRTGPVYSPAVDIFENDSSITLLADMPGVNASDLEIDLRENVLTLAGRVTQPATASESNVLRDYRPGTF